MKTVIFLFCLLSVAPLWASPLTFDSLLKEAHLAVDAHSVTMDFPFENKSDKEAVIKRYDATCSCTSVGILEGKMVYKPGERGTVRATYDVKALSGTVKKSVMLYVDDDLEGAPSVVLTSKINIPIVVVTEPKTVNWTMGEKPEGKNVIITMKHTEPIRILRVTGAVDGIQHEIRTIEEGKKYELVLTPKDTDRPALGIFRIETDCAIQKHRVQQVFAVIRR